MQDNSMTLIYEKGKQTKLCKKIPNVTNKIEEKNVFPYNTNEKLFENIEITDNVNSSEKLKFISQKKKNYILQEGNSIPFLVTLGIMNSDGKVFNAKYDKFRQINRFLEFIDDAVNDVLKIYQINKNENHPVLKICDFGCGKSYLTFAIHYFLTQIKKIPCQIEGLDLKSA